MTKPTVILLRETFWQSAAKDAVTCGSLIGVVGTGVVLNSAAMQWIAGILWIVWLLARINNYGRAVSIEEARQKLDALSAPPSSTTQTEEK